MVITVTLNPAIDRTLYLGNLNKGQLNRVSNSRIDIGGKGINVSKVLKNFGIDSICTGFIGGTWENYFSDELNTRNINSEFIHIKKEIRTNIKIVDKLNSENTDINESGPEISYEELKQFISNFEEMCHKGDVVVLSGGVGPTIPKNIYYTLINIAKDKGALTVLDAEGELLSEGIKAKPDIIKPNEFEFGILCKSEFTSEQDIAAAGGKFVSKGIGKVLVSLGSQGAIYITQSGAYSCGTIKVPVKSTVGAGDSMVAALVYSVINNLDDRMSLKFAIACGAAAVSLEGTQACTMQDVNKLLQLNSIETMEV